MNEEELTVQLITPDGEPLPRGGILLEINLYIGDQRRYKLGLGRTNSDGVCRTSLGELERELEADRRFFLMDYNTPLAECDKVVGIAAPTAGELTEREAARAKWWPEMPALHDGAANQRVRCPERKFELHRGSNNAFNLVCEVEAED